MMWLTLALMACRAPTAPGDESSSTNNVPSTPTTSSADSSGDPTPLAGRDCAPEPDWVDVAGIIMVELTEMALWDTLSIGASFHRNEVHDDDHQFERLATADPSDDCYWWELSYDPEPHGEPVSGGVVTVMFGDAEYLLRPYGNDDHYPDYVVLDRDHEELAQLRGKPIHVSATGSSDTPSFSFKDVDVYPQHRINLYEPAPDAQLHPNDVVFRWDPGSTLDGRMEVLLLAGIPNTLMTCTIDDDGEWSPPPELFHHMDEPQGLDAVFRARQPCYKELDDGRFLKIWHRYEANGGADIIP
jgi:hypothetical protein